MSDVPLEQFRIGRRRVLAAGGAVLAAIAVLGLVPGAALATPRAAREKLTALTGSDGFTDGRIQVRMPAFTEQGPYTWINIVVDSPMTEHDHVQALHIVAARNTVPEVASYRFGPEAGRAEITTRIRLRKSQTVVVAAQMNDGSVFVGKARTKVSRGGGGCG